MLKKIENFIKLNLSLIILELSKYLKLAFVLGSNQLFFSFTQVFMPVLGLYRNIQLSAILLAIRTSIKILLIGFSPSVLLYYLPTFCGNAYLAIESKAVKIAIPLICMFMFFIHPIGNQAIFYSLYWLIPIAIASFNPKSIFLQALGSTFTTHSVGSVLWLYTKQMDASAWINLMPLVCVERTLIALAITSTYCIIKKLENMLNTEKNITSLFFFGQ